MVNRTVALIIRNTCQLWWFDWLNYGTEILLLAAPRASGRNFIFLWGGQVRLFSYSRIESEWTTTLVTKATNTRLKQQTFQLTETKKFLDLSFITLRAFHSPFGQGVAWFKEGKNPSWKHIYHYHIALNTPCLPPKIYHDSLFRISLGKGVGRGR